jgi:hypothetical protein
MTRAAAAISQNWPSEPVGRAVVKMMEPKPAWSRRLEGLPLSTAAAGGGQFRLLGATPCISFFF